MTAEDVVMAGISPRAGISLRERVSVTAVFSVSVRTEISVREGVSVRARMYVREGMSVGEGVSVTAWIRLGRFSKTAGVFPPSPSITFCPCPISDDGVVAGHGTVRDVWSHP